MNGHQSKKSYLDGILILIGGVAIAISLYLFFQDDGLGRSAQTEMKPVGQVALSHKDVRRRIQSGFSWASLSSSDDVFEGDSIFTGDESEAAVNLHNGANLKIDPKSLIVIRTMDNRLQLDLQYGSLSGRVTEGAPIAFIQNGRLQEISGQDAEVRIDSSGPDGEATIRVIKGDVQIKTSSLGDKSGQSTTNSMGANEVMELKPTQAAPIVKRQQLELIAPSNGKSLWLAPGAHIPFAWKQTDGSSQSNTFEIASDPNFKAIIYNEAPEGTELNVPVEKLSMGALHWRVRPSNPVEASRILPATGKIVAYPDQPPLPTFPEDLQDFAADLDSEGKHKQVEMMWDDKAGSKSFDIELASDEGFTHIIVAEKVEKKNHLSPPLAEGSYFWRVRGLHPERENSPWSRIMRFSVGPDAATPEVPQLARTLIKYEIPTSVLNRAPAGVSVNGQGVIPEHLEPFAWSEAKNAEGYEVEIASDDKFINSIKHPVGSERTFAPQEVKPGAMYIRVRALGQKGLPTAPSETGRLEVSLPAPAIKPVKSEVAKFANKADLDKAKHTFDLTWTPRPFAESYELEWGADASFKQSKKFRLKGNQRSISVTQSKAYAARVRALGPGGVPISPFSPALSASYKKELTGAAPQAKPIAAVPPKPKVPTKAPASVKPQLPQGRGPALQEPLRDTSFVAMEGSVPFVNFRWKAMPNAASYEVQIAQDADFVNIVETVKASSTRYTVKTELPEGRVFWRVRAIINGTPTDWSNVRDINVLYQ